MIGEEWTCPICAALTEKPAKHARWHKKMKAKKGPMGPPGPMGMMGPKGEPYYFSPSQQSQTPEHDNPEGDEDD